VTARTGFQAFDGYDFVRAEDSLFELDGHIDLQVAPSFWSATTSSWSKAEQFLEDFGDIGAKVTIASKVGLRP